MANLLPYIGWFSHVLSSASLHDPVSTQWDRRHIKFLVDDGIYSCALFSGTQLLGLPLRSKLTLHFHNILTFQCTYSVPFKIIYQKVKKILRNWNYFSYKFIPVIFALCPGWRQTVYYLLWVQSLIRKDSYLKLKNNCNSGKTGEHVSSCFDLYFPLVWEKTCSCCRVDWMGKGTEIGGRWITI